MKTKDNKLLLSLSAKLSAAFLRKKAADSVQEKYTLEILGNILNGLDVIICVTDPDTDEVLFANDHMKKRFGVDDECVGKKCYKVFRHFEEKCESCPCNLIKKYPEQVVVWEDHHPVTKRVYRSCSRFINWPGGKKVHLEHSIDITKNKEAEREIAEKNEQLEIALHKAENASKAKSAFLANMSHEIRTPMNAILGIAEIQLRDETLSPETEEGLEKIYDSGNLLLGIINDILDLSKIEAGKLEIIPVKYDLPGLINDAVQINRVRYNSEMTEFSLDVDENIPLSMSGDELRLKQILGNILSNAFKYTNRGEIKMSVSCEDAQGDDVTLIVRVSDTGQGMTEEQLSSLFNEYTRFNMEANRTTVGTGLGMSITKHLVEMMNGEITVESEINKGSTFIVRIPQKRVSSLVCGKDIAEKLRTFRFQSASASKKSLILREYMPYGSVLVVDDIASNIYVIKGMLLPYGLQIDTASSGFEAIDKIKAGREYDVVFMDHMMPKMDGIETVKNIRAMGYKNSIVALTANAIVGQAEMFIKNGFDGYISKPIDSRELNHILNEFIRNKKPPEIVKAARQEQRALNDEQAQLWNETAGDETEIKNEKTEKISEIEKFFLSDAENALAELESMLAAEEAELISYETAVHGMKSALANIGEAELSAAALRLEKAAMEKNLAVIAGETPAFVDALKKLIKKISSRAEKNSTKTKVSLSNEDAGFLRGKLLEIETACRTFDVKAARGALVDLLNKTWPKYIDDFIDEINVHLLHSSFKKASAAAQAVMEVINK